jgi:hypothetical protein
MIVVEVGEVSMPCLPGKGRSVLPSPLRVMGSPSMGPPIIVHYRSGGSLQVGSMTMAPEPSLRGERLMPPNQLMMNSTLLK